jgi:acyl-CoA thioester hydrolase
MEKTPHSFYTIRFSDCDPFGHLNNARYVDYFLNAREDHLKACYGIELRDFYARGISWVVGGHEILYAKPADYSEKVRIESTLIAAGEAFPDVEFSMTDAAQTQLKSIMRTRFVPVDVKTGKRRAHPDDFMAFVSAIQNGALQQTRLQERLATILSELKMKRETA